MGIVLGPNQYGKAENRVVRIYRDSQRHEIRDVNVSTSLRGDFGDAYRRGDQANVLPTDSQKNTCFAFAKRNGITQIERYAWDLAEHFVDDIDPVRGARIDVQEYAWQRVSVGGREHDHCWVRNGQEVRTTVVTMEGSGDARHTWVVSGLRDLVLLKSTGSEFSGFLKDRYTTLAETHDRVLATALTARWRYRRPDRDDDWDTAYDDIRRILMETFATVHSLALQQSLWEMGRAVLEAHPEVAEVRLSAPNKHHIAPDLTPYGLDNPNEVFQATDRPYGLIECAVTSDDAPDPGLAWHTDTG
ncbi:MAG: factor-independent urate hydroxylase [Nocardioidaceae bacterium]